MGSILVYAYFILTYDILGYTLNCEAVYLDTKEPVQTGNVDICAERLIYHVFYSNPTISSASATACTTAAAKHDMTHGIRFEEKRNGVVFAISTV